MGKSLAESFNTSMAYDDPNNPHLELCDYLRLFPNTLECWVRHVPVNGRRR